MCVCGGGRCAALKHVRATGLMPCGAWCRLPQVIRASQHEADVQIGRFMSAVRASHPNTLVVFSGDNGPEDPHVYFNAVGSAGIYRGRKRSLCVQQRPSPRPAPASREPGVSAFGGGGGCGFVCVWGGGRGAPVGHHTGKSRASGSIDEMAKLSRWFPHIVCRVLSTTATREASRPR